MSTPWSIAIFGLCVLASVALTAVTRAYALGRGLLDLPNERSSHSEAIPRGGGIAIVAVVLVAAATLTALGKIAPTAAIAWLGGGGLIAFVGYMDDRRGLSVGVRLFAQILAAGAALYATHGLPLVPWDGANVNLGIAGWALGLLIIMWATNLFNFMDGIDGIAAQQAMFMAGGAYLLQGGMATGSAHVMLCVICAAATGFLLWNWAPARIFMGDVGSGFLGFALALAALISWRAGPMTLWTWLILDGLFVVDATVTLVTRTARRARVFTAHREHAYQRLAIRLRSHAKVSAIYFALNLLWLWPWAIASVRRPEAGALIACVALAPLIALAAILGAGRRLGSPDSLPLRQDHQEL